jgi:hypothetical protein
VFFFDSAALSSAFGLGSLLAFLGPISAFSSLLFSGARPTSAASGAVVSAAPSASSTFGFLAVGNRVTPGVRLRWRKSACLQGGGGAKERQTDRRTDGQRDGKTDRQTHTNLSVR